jgi:hypothetical protein
MELISVRILRADPRSTQMGYVKGRIVKVDRDTAAGWFATKFAEPVEIETAMLEPSTERAMLPRAKGRKQYQVQS